MKKVSLLKIKNTLAKSGLSQQAQEAILGNLVPSIAREKKPLVLRRYIVKQVLKELETNGQCGLFLTKKRKVYFASAAHTKISIFNFQKPKYQKAAMAKRFNGNGHSTASQWEPRVESGIPVPEQRQGAIA